MNFRPSTALGSVRDRMMMMTSITNRAGMPILLNFSMPESTPPATMKKQITMKASRMPMETGMLVIILTKDDMPSGMPPKIPIRLMMM